MSTTTDRITINILDVNDNPPKFPLKYRTALLTEDIVNTTITKVKAFDNDSNSDIRYSIIGLFSTSI